METQACKYCGQSAQLIKSGLNGNGSQRFWCKQCRRYSTLEAKPRGCEPALKQQAVQLYLQGIGLRAIARQLAVHHRSVANWVNAHLESLPEHERNVMIAKRRMVSTQLGT